MPARKKPIPRITTIVPTSDNLIIQDIHFRLGRLEDITAENHKALLGRIDESDRVRAEQATTLASELSNYREITSEKIATVTRWQGTVEKIVGSMIALLGIVVAAFGAVTNWRFGGH